MPILSAEEKLSMMKTNPPTAYELECVEGLAVGEFEIGFQKINDILDEAMEVFQRTARSAFGVAGDSMVAIFTAQGDLANGACGTYLHEVIQPVPIKYVMKYYSENPGIKDGDIWYINDALYGGIHNPDVLVFMPVFYAGKIIAWASAGVHTSESGGVEPGGMEINAPSRFYEGFNAPPIKVGENFELRADFLELLAVYGLRAPQMVLADMRARSATVDRARMRLVEIANKKGSAYVIGLLQKMLIVAEEGARKRIKSWADGTYRCVNFCDAVGMQEGLVRSSYMTVVKKDDEITFDFTGTSPENISSYNAHVQAVVGHISNYIYEYVFHDLPISSATFAPIHFKFPPNSCLNPDVRAATSCAVMIATGVMSGMHNVFAKLMFPTEDWKQVTASQGNAGNAYVLAGMNQWNTFYADMQAYSLNTEGQGGRVNQDGVDAFGFPWCVFGRAPDVELMENELPILIPVCQHWPDSGGAGKYRGGCGTFQMWVAYHNKDVWFLCIADNSNLQTPQGLFGGYAPSTVPGISIRKADILKQLQEGAKGLNLSFDSLIHEESIAGDWQIEFFGRAVRMYSHGDVINFCFATGGSGYGDPLEREPKYITKDLVERRISLWSAKNVYKVACDPETYEVDYEKTKKLRDDARKERLAKGKPYSQFIRTWEKKVPPQEILSFYGTWPDAQPVAPIIRP
jgi:acetophenone carboxylase